MNATALPVQARNTRLPAPSIIRPSGAFAKFGIDHLSPSLLNTWIACPSLWVMNRLIGRWGPTSCAMHRGVAAEAGVSAALFDPKASISECAIMALQHYDKLAANSSDPKRDVERSVIAGMVAQAVDLLRPFGIPDHPEEGAHQHRIEITFDEVSVPVIGFLDWRFPEGTIVDLKTTMRVPSSMSDSHIRQGAVYQRSHSNHEVRFCYASDKKGVLLDLDNAAYAVGITEIKHAAIRLERFLSISSDPYELASILTPDYGTFHWNDPETRRLGELTFGF